MASADFSQFVVTTRLSGETDKKIIDFARIWYFLGETDIKKHRFRPKNLHASKKSSNFGRMRTDSQDGSTREEKFVSETHIRHAPQLVLISTYGVNNSQYINPGTRILTMDELFNIL